MSDQELIRILLYRTHHITAIEEGRILVTHNNKEIIQMLESVFAKKMWLHHQIDYI